MDISKADRLIVEAMGFTFISSGPGAVCYTTCNPRSDIIEGRDSFFMTVLRWAKGRQWWPDFVSKTGWHDSSNPSYVAIPLECIDGHALSRRLYEYLVTEFSD